MPLPAAPCALCGRTIPQDIGRFKTAAGIICSACKVSPPPKAGPAGRKPKSAIPDETCAQCGKAIKGKGIANLSAGRILCTQCYRHETGTYSGTRHATPGQIKFLDGLGFPNAQDYTFQQACHTLDRAQAVRYYANQIATREWGIDAFNVDLRPLLRATFADPVMLEEIFQIMSAADAAAYKVQEARQECGESVPLEECRPRLPRDLNYAKVRDGMAALINPSASGSAGQEPLPSLWTLLKRTFFSWK